MKNRVDIIKEHIEQALAPESLSIQDDSAKHIGHEGAKGGLGHFNVTVVSKQFENIPLIKRHRMVYAAVGDLMKTDIHALGIKAYTPNEYKKV